MADSMKKLYLFFYNLSMFLGFAYALTVMSGNYLAKPDVFPSECWSAVGSFFKASIYIHQNLRPIYLGFACSDVPRGDKSAPRSHQGICSNRNDPGKKNDLDQWHDFLRKHSRCREETFSSGR